MPSRLLALIAALSLTGCAAWTLVEGEAQRVANRYTVAPQIQWSRIKQGDVELWTVDGIGLQALRFFDPIEEGEGLFTRSPDSEARLPVFRADMTASDVQEFVVHSVQLGGGVQVEASGLRPWKLGSVDGFRFELSFLNDAGLEMQGVIAGAVDAGKLYLITYTGTRAHYFPKHLPAVERLLASVRSAI